MSRDASLRAGLQIFAGEVTHRGLAEDVKRPWKRYEDLASQLRSA
jgi:hypothetical protein